jgi:ubiquinone/menaquinone biosynthesis C-methylase UbiE
MGEIGIDAVRSFWDSRPCNIRHSTETFGSAKYFDEVEARKYFVEPHIPHFAAFNSWTGKKVLEIGCGIGTDAINFMRFGADYTGLELSPESLRVARLRANVFSLNGRLIEGDAEELENYLEPQAFDLIYSFGVLHHTPDILRAFRSIRAFCHSETKFKFMVYASRSYKNAMILAGLDQPEAQTGCPIANTYTELEIRQLLEDAGFEMTDIRQDHIFPWIVEKYVRYEYEKQPWFAAMPEDVFSALEKSLGWHLLVEARPK